MCVAHNAAVCRPAPALCTRLTSQRANLRCALANAERRENEIRDESHVWRLPMASVRTTVDVDYLADLLAIDRELRRQCPSVIVFIGCLAARDSLETSLCNGVSTSRGATALKRIPCFAYSIARLRVRVFTPTFVIILHIVSTTRNCALPLIMRA